jgi:[acyl-carrier-protein] S-malonyltransferase
MFEAGQLRPGTMAAILGLDDGAVAAVCREVSAGICVSANLNAEGQIVISGDRAGVAEALELARAAGARKVIELNVSGAFHSPLMEPAADGLRSFLGGVQFSDSAFPIVSNVTAAPESAAARARDLLVRQLTEPVRWAESVARMVAEGVTRFVEVGPGNVLCGLNKRNARGLPCAALGRPEDMGEFS